MKKFSSPAEMFSEKLAKYLKRAGIVVVSLSLGAATFITISSDKKTVYSEAKMLSVAEVEPTAVEDTKVEYSRVEYNDLQIALAEAEQADRIERAEKRAAAVALAKAAEEEATEEVEVQTEEVAKVVTEAPTEAPVPATEAPVTEAPAPVETTAPTTEVVEVVYVDDVSSETGAYLGTYTATAYCGCSSCCGKSDGITASGTRATEGRTVAAPSTFSFGTELVIDGHTYVVEDRGGSISGNRIDIYFDSHQAALNYGRRSVEVYSK